MGLDRLGPFGIYIGCNDNGSVRVLVGESVHLTDRNRFKDLMPLVRECFREWVRCGSGEQDQGLRCWNYSRRNVEELKGSASYDHFH